MSSPGEGLAAAPRRPLATSVGWLLAAHLGTIAVGFATVIVVSRLLDAEALGRWRFAQAILTYLTVFADMGLTTLAVREIAARAGDPDRFAGPVLFIRLVVGVALLILATTVALSAAPSLDVGIFYVVAFLTVIPNALSLLHVLQGKERLGTFAIARLAVTAVAGLLGLASLLVTRELIVLIIWPLIVGLVVDAWLAWMTARRLRIRLHIGTPSVWMALAAGGTPFLVGAIAVQLISHADAVIIGSLRGEAALGIYAAAYLLAGQLLFLAGPVAAAIYPRLAVLHERGESSVARALEQTTGLLGLLVLPVCIGAAVVADDIIRLLYGERYVEASALLLVLLGMPAIGFYNVALAQALNAVRRQRAVMRVSLAAAAINVGFNVALVPVIGLMGAAITAVITEAVTAVLYTSAGFRGLGLAPLRAYTVPLAAAIPMGFVAVVSDRWGMPLPVTVALAAVAYAAGIAIRPPEAVATLRRVLRGLRLPWSASAML